jgi:hypothetical protein
MLDATTQSRIEGERRLMIAVMAHALRGLFHDASKPGRGAARRLQQDLRWLTSPDRSDLFSFERICEALGLDGDRIRQRVLAELNVSVGTASPMPQRTRRSRTPVMPYQYDERLAALG